MRTPLIEKIVMPLKTSFAIFSALIGAAIASPSANPLEIKNAWVRATVPGQKVAAAYLEITSAAEATLIKVETTAASLTEIHSMKMENGVMRMQALESLLLPTKKTVTLNPGGKHLMLMGLKKPLKTGDSVSFRLTIRDGVGREETTTINAPVRYITK